MKSNKIILVFLMVCLFFAACSQSDADTDENKTGGPTDGIPGETTEATTEIERPPIPGGTDYKGYEFRVLVPAFYESSSDLYAAEENGDTLNDAVYKRNRIVENLLNIRIKSIVGSNSTNGFDQASNAQKSILSGDDAFDVTYQIIHTGLAFGGCLENLYKVPNMDLSKSWWDRRLIEELSYKKNKLYYIKGDIGHSNISGVFCLMFNKQLFADFEIDYPYETVRQGKWTFDKFEQIVKDTSRDLDGNGKMDENDQWGYMGNSGEVLRFMFGCGEQIIKLDQEGIPRLDPVSDRHIQVLQTIGELMSDKNYVLLQENIKDGGLMTEKAWSDGRASMYACTVAGLSYYRAIEYDFGVLPFPKFDENQKEYSNHAHSIHGGAITVPITNSDLERTGMILEVMAGYSPDIIIPALFEVALKSKFTRDEDSAQMIDIIIKSKRFDLAVEYGWGNGPWSDLYWSVYSDLTIKGAKNIVSSIEKHRPKAESDLEKWINAFDAMD